MYAHALAFLPFACALDGAGVGLGPEGSLDKYISVYGISFVEDLAGWIVSHQ
jgi:hypothetical protein